MDRKVDAISIKQLEEGQFQVLEICLQDCHIEHLKSYVLKSEQDLRKDFLNKNIGKLNLVFPLNHAFVQELELPKKTSRKSLQQILDMNSEVSLPVQLQEPLRYGLIIEAGSEKKKILQVLLPREAVPFNEELALGSMEMHPGALYQGFSQIFNFPMSESCLLFYEIESSMMIAWGKDHQILGIRVLKSDDHMKRAEIIKQTLIGCPEIDSFFSWSYATDELNKYDSKRGWHHLKNNGIPTKLRGYEELMDMVCSAYAHGVGYKNEIMMLNSTNSSLLRIPAVKRSVARALILIILIGSLLQLAGIFKLRNEASVQNKLKNMLQDAFYTVFSPKTPMIDPIKQIEEHVRLKGQGGMNRVSILPYKFISLIQSIYVVKSSEIDVQKIKYYQKEIRLEGVSAHMEVVYEWAHLIDNTNVKSVNVLGVNQNEVGGFDFEVVIHII